MHGNVWEWTADAKNASYPEGWLRYGGVSMDDAVDRPEACNGKSPIAFGMSDRSARLDAAREQQEERRRACHELPTSSLTTFRSPKWRLRITVLQGSARILPLTRTARFVYLTLRSRRADDLDWLAGSARQRQSDVGQQSPPEKEAPDGIDCP